jgi:hypothetical protein
MICLVCGKRKARRVDPYGYLPCLICNKRQREISKPKTTVEITTPEIKESRKVFEDDIVQPFNDGHLSKEYVEAHPERIGQMLKEGNVTVKEVNEAKEVWDLNYYKNE